MSTPAKSQIFPLIQALRALAAFSVALLHISHDALSLAPQNHLLRGLYGFMPWGAGVDIFFVISGFVIVHAAKGLYAAPGAPRRFIARRVARIVPLYWGLTSLFLLSLWLLPSAIHGDIGGPAYLLTSYLFIPAARPDGLVQPALGLGWTLNYEMFFYAAFMGFLRWPKGRAVPAAAVTLAGFVVLGALVRLPGTILPFWASPIILEFCAGMLLALLPGRVVLPGAARAGLAILAMMTLHLDTHDGTWRALAWGLPACALVLAATTGRAQTRLPVLEQGLVLLGDASYALYLIHPFVMRAMDLIWRHAHFSGNFLYIALCLILAQIAALATHHYLERPATFWLRRKLEPQRLTPAAA